MTGSLAAAWRFCQCYAYGSVNPSAALSRFRLRRQTVEHTFGTLKSWMGATHFLTKTLGRVSTEMGLHVLAYNLKRVMKILGTGALIEAIRA